MAKDGERTLTGLARRVEVFLDLVIFNELRKIAVAEDTTVSKILTQIVVEHFRERGVPRRSSDPARQGARAGAGSGAVRERAQQHSTAGAAPQGAPPPGDPSGQRRRRRRRRGGRGPKSDGGGADGGGETQP